MPFSSSHLGAGSGRCGDPGIGRVAGGVQPGLDGGEGGQRIGPVHRDRRPHTSTPRPKGSGSTMRSQLGSTRARVVRAAQGSTGRPETAASCATPGAATPARAARPVRGDRHHVALRQHPQQHPHAGGAALRRRPGATPRAGGGMHHVEVEAAHHLADEAAVAVAGDQDMRLHPRHPGSRRGPAARASASSAGVHARRRR